MTERRSEGIRVGVGSFDCTPDTGPFFGRLRGLAMVRLDADAPIVVLAADGVRVTRTDLHALAEKLSLPVDCLFVWSGGRPRTELPVEAAAEAIRRAAHDAVPGVWRVGSAVAWSLRAPDPDSPLLAGQRLTRSHRQLRNHAPDPILATLVEQLNGATSPPGGSWSERLVDQRVLALGAWRADGQLLGAMGWWPGQDLFAERGWATAGARGHAARQWSERLSSDAHRVPTVVVGPDAPGLLGGRPRPASDPREAIRRSEQAGESVARVLARACEAATEAVDVQLARGAFAPSQVLARDETPVSLPESVASDVVGVSRLTLDDHVLVSVPGTLSDGLRLRMQPASGRGWVFWSGPAEGRWGALVTPREAHHLGFSDGWHASSGVWMADCVAGLRAVQPASAAVREPWQPEPVERVVTDLEPCPRSPHLQATIRRGSKKGGTRAEVRLEARWRLTDSALPFRPGDRWQVRLEWLKNDAPQPVYLRGVPVDDLHQGMRIRVGEDRSGRQMFLRWSAPEPRRWAGRTFVLRLGPAYGGPMVSAPFTMK